jgi:glycosyltransferase involved in cell wall biosynthesis
MLRRLFRQLTALDDRFAVAPEIILVHDVADGSAGQILTETEAANTSFGGNVRTCPCEGLDYYDQKNLGACEARGELIIFVDSDVIPEDGWLEALLECYIEERPDVVAGATYINGPSLYDRAFALFWFFPTEVDYQRRSRALTRYFFANNVMFRATVFRRAMFPDAPLVRGRCIMLADQILKSGHRIIAEPRARTQHPAPNGLKHFVYRALCEGQDNAHFESAHRKSFTALRHFKGNILRTSRSIASHHRDVGLNRTGALGAMFIAFAYYGLTFCGELITAAFPHLIRRNMRV